MSISLRQLRPNIVQSIRAYRVEDLQAAANELGHHFLYAKLAKAQGPVVFLLPTQGGNEWDRPGGPLADPEALAAFVDEMRHACPPNVQLIELDAHINDPAFHDAALQVFDGWVKAGAL
jgi:uncharacterized protein (UPF0261 family)